LYGGLRTKVDEVEDWIEADAFGADALSTYRAMGVYIYT
jgi:hypothetical protein